MAIKFEIAAQDKRSLPIGLKTEDLRKKDLAIYLFSNPLIVDNSECRKNEEKSLTSENSNFKTLPQIYIYSSRKQF